MALGQRKNDPHARLEALERWSARATLLILIGILVDIALALTFTREFWERIGSIAANAFIGIGLIVEYIVIGRAVIAGGEAQRLSDEKIAESNARAKEAELQTVRLGKKVGPRQIPVEEFAKSLEGKPQLPVEVMYLKDDGEAFQLALQICDGLRLAKWKTWDPIAIPADLPAYKDRPAPMGVGGQPTGVSVVAHRLTVEDLTALFERPFELEGSTAFLTLHGALLKVLDGPFGMAAGHANPPPEGKLRIVIGSKP